MPFKPVIAILAFAMLRTAAFSDVFSPGDTWVLDGATDWTNSPHFAGLGLLQATGLADTNKVWHFLLYNDYARGELFSNPVELDTYVNDGEGGYRYQTHTSRSEPWISDSRMSMQLRTDNARYAGAVAWESPVAGTFQMQADLSYGVTSGVGTVSFGVFYQDVSAGLFYQLQNGVMRRTDTSVGFTAVQTSAVLNVSVSMDAGDRLIYLQRAYAPKSGTEWLNSSGPTVYAVRWSYHRNLAVTCLGLTSGMPVATTHRSWRRRDLHCRADVEDTLRVASGGTAVVRDRRLPASLPPVFNYYVSTNEIMGHVETNSTGLRDGEQLGIVAPYAGDFFGHRDAGCRENLLYYRHNATAGWRAQPAVWFFRPPAPGRYSIRGTLDEQSVVANSLGSISYWLGTAALDNFGTNPVVSRIEILASQKLPRGAPGVDVDLRCTLDSTNHCIFMTIWGETTSGDRRQAIADDLLIARERTGSVITVR